MAEESSSQSCNLPTKRLVLPSFAVGELFGQVTVQDPETTGSAMTRHTTYLVVGQLNGQDPFSIRRRYSDFEWLRKALTSNFPGVRVAPLPKKQVAGRFEESFVEARRAGLEEFLQRCLKKPQLSVVLRKFFEAPKDKEVYAPTSIDELKKTFDSRSLTEMSQDFKTSFSEELPKLEVPTDDSKLQETRAFLEGQLTRLRELTTALRESVEAQRAAVTSAANAQARLAAVCGGEAGELAVAQAAEQPRVDVVAAMRQQQEVLQDAPALHYDVLLAAAERELDESEAMQEALQELESLQQRLVAAKVRTSALEATQKRLQEGSGYEPSTLGKLFGQKDRDSQREDTVRQLKQSTEDARSAEEWYSAARAVTVGKELDAFVAEKVALHRWLRNELAQRSRSTALKLASTWEPLTC